MKKLISWACFIILSLVLMSFKICESGDKSDKISIDDFPMTVGSQWTYLRTDKLIRQIGRKEPTYVTEIETVTVKVVRTKKKTKEIVSKWVRKFTAKVDTQYVILRKDTLEFTTSTSPAGSPFNFKIPFPIKVGNRWHGHYPPSDSFKVVQEDSLEVAVGKFSQIHLIERGTFMPNSGGYSKWWIVPKIGIVKMSRWGSFTLAGESTIENWELIKYEIK